MALAVAQAMLALALVAVSPASAGPTAETDLTFGPREAPSAAGMTYLLVEAGLLEGPEPAGAPGASTSGADAAEPGGQPGVDVTVNNPADDTPENTTQSETSLAVLGNTICAGYNNSGPGGLSGLSRSPDLGATWTDLGGIGQFGDPVLAAHEATGTFYYAEIATIGGDPAIGVARSTDDCLTFGAPIDAGPGASAIPTTTLNDKPWIAVDNTGGANDGDVYVCWTRFDSTGESELRFSRSTDGGATYVNEQILAPSGTGPFGCSVGVGPGGEVFVAWADRAGPTIDDIRFRRSLDGGVTFDPAISISTGNRHPGIDTIVDCSPNGMTRPTLTGNIRMLHQAWLAVDTSLGPSNGNIYVVWASDPPGTPDNSDAFFSRSTDGGLTWSARVQVGAGGGATDQFEPFVAVGGTGALSIAWYDRRNDPANNSLIDVFKSFSRDGGTTLDPIERVTDVSFPVPPINPNFDPMIGNCYMGEYIAVAGDDTNFYYLWGDNRNTLVTPNFPTGRPDPDVFFDFQAAPDSTPMGQADLKVRKEDRRDPAKVGRPLKYQIFVRNRGGDEATGVTLIDRLPAGVTFVSATPRQGTCAEAGGIVTCDLGSLATGGFTKVRIVVKPTAPGTLRNTVEVSANEADPDTGNNQDDEKTTVRRRNDDDDDDDDDGVVAWSRPQLAGSRL